jgi:hypothetical protein
MKRRFRGRSININVKPPHKTIVIKPDAASLFNTALILEAQSDNPRPMREVFDDLFGEHLVRQNA